MADPATAWVSAGAYLEELGVRLPVAGIRWLHLETRQASADPVPRLIAAGITRATLLIRWRASRLGKDSPAFRTPGKPGTTKLLHQLRSVVLPEKVPAHLVRDWILGLGIYAGRRRVQETLGPEISGRKLQLVDILVVIPRPRSRTSKTGSALREYFSERIVPHLLAGRRAWAAGRVAERQMARVFERELRAAMTASPTRSSSSRSRSAGSRRSSSRRSRRR